MQVWKVLALGVLILATGFLLGDIYGGYASGFIGTLLSFSLLLVGYGFSQGFNIVGWLKGHFSLPKLEYGDHALKNEVGDYFLRVHKRGSAIAKNCEALLTIIGTNRGEVPTPWEHQNAPRLRDIRGQFADIILFSIDKNYDEKMQQGKSIVFYDAGDDGFRHGTHNEYDEAFERTLRIVIISDSARLPDKPYSKKVSKLIEEAVEQTAE